MIRLPVIDHEKTGHLCRQERLSRGLTGKRVAELMGVGEPYISDLERGRRNWTAVMLQQYENALNGIRT